jgi:hypothetical protein
VRRRLRGDVRDVDVVRVLRSGEDEAFRVVERVGELWVDPHVLDRP